MNAVYLRALSRPPSDAELSVAKELLGDSPNAEGVEDLLWAITMLPEFQLIQ